MHSKCLQRMQQPEQQKTTCSDTQRQGDVSLDVQTKCGEARKVTK